MSILSILIPTLTKRARVYNSLKESLDNQREKYGLFNKVFIVALENAGGATIGHYRNECIKICTTPYCWFIDDDDKICDDALPTIIDVIEKEKPDGIGFKGYVQQAHSRNVKEPFIVKHGSIYGKENEVYLRPLNHIAPKKTDLYRRVPFPDLKFGEDHAQCMALAESGLIETASFIDKEIYFYFPNPHGY